MDTCGPKKTEDLLADLERYKVAYELSRQDLFERDQQLLKASGMYTAARQVAIEINYKALVPINVDEAIQKRFDINEVEARRVDIT